MAAITVSIIIPMRNEAKYIGRCLDTVLANELPCEEYEILVVDGQSTDNSRQIVLEKAARFSCIHLLHNQQRIAPTALNIGIRQARGRYIIRLDAHSEYPPDYIGNCIAELKRTGAANVGGRWITQPGAATDVARAIAYLTQEPAGVGNATYRLGGQDRYVDTVPFGAFRRDIFDQVGLFSEDLVRHQDFELNARIRAAGGQIYLSPKIYNTYYNVPTFSKFMRQAYFNGLWVARSWIRYPVSFCARHAAPLAMVCGLAGLSVLAAFLPLVRPLLLAICVLYSAFVLRAGLNIARRHGARFLLLVPALTICYHLVYGVGSVAGVITAAKPRIPFPVDGSHKGARAA